MFDECTPFHADREYTARSTERTHRWLDRCLAWHAEHGPEGQLVYGIVQGGTDEDLRRSSAQAVAARDGLGGIAIGGSLGEDKAQMFEVVEWTIEELPEAQPRHLLGIGEVDDLVRGVELGIDTFDCAMPTRIGRHGMAIVPDPSKRWRVDLAKARWREVDEPLLEGCPCPACADGLLARLPALPVPREGADRDAPAHDPQPRLPAAPDGRAARRDRRGPPGRGGRRGPRGSRAVGAGGEDPFKAFEAEGWSARAGTYGALMARATAFAIEPLLDAARVGPGVRVLDVGCGPGALSAAAAARGALVTGADLAEGMLAQARRNHPEIEFVHADAEDAPVRGRRVRRRARRVHRQPPARTPSAPRPSWRVSPRRVALAMWGPQDEVAILGLPARARRRIWPRRRRRGPTSSASPTPPRSRR